MRRCSAFVVACLAVGCQTGGGEDGASAVQVEQVSQAVSEDVVSTEMTHPPDPHWNVADEAINAPLWLGNDDKGGLFMPLYRGTAAAIEDYVYTPPGGDCTGLKGTARIEWDSSKNTVHFLVKWKKVPVHPVVHRTEGVDYFSDQFHQAAKDIDTGAYRFWTILGDPTRKTALFYYDYSQHLVGSEFDFPSGPPPGTFPVPLPVFTLTSTKFIFPNADGSMVKDFTIPYDHITTEGGTYSAAYITFPALDLCQANPVQPILGQLRPYLSPWQPANAGPSWRDVIHGGPVFDTTVDDASNLHPELGNQLPYVVSGVAFLGNAPLVQGGIPNGQRLLLPAAIAQIAPPIGPVPGGNGPGCHSFLADPHITGPNLCQSSQ